MSTAGQGMGFTYWKEISSVVILALSFAWVCERTNYPARRAACACSGQ
jgi:hypothetical protein